MKTLEWLCAKADSHDVKLAEEGMHGFWEMATHKDNRRDMLTKVTSDQTPL